MSKYVKKASAVMLAMVIFFGMLLVPGTNLMTAEAATLYDLWVNGEQFSSDKLTIACGSGKAVYSPTDSTLTLTNATITKNDADGAGICLVDGAGITIALNGKNTVNVSSDDAVSALSGSITIKDGAAAGIGSLDTSASSYGIYAKSGIVIQSGDVSFTASGSYGCSIKASGEVKIAGGNVSCIAAGTGSHISGAKVVISGGSVDASAANIGPAPVNSSGKALVRTEYTVPSVSEVKVVESVKVKVNNEDYTYTSGNMLTDKSGRLVLWLPEGAVVSDAAVSATEATTASTTYSETSSTTSSTTTSKTTTKTTASTTAKPQVPAYVKMTGNNVNFRESAGNGDVIDKLPIFAWYPCTAVTTSGNVKWYKITVGTTTGWVSGTYAAPETEGGSFIQVTGNNVNVRTSAPSGSVIDTVRENTYYKYSDSKDVSGTKWYKIALGTTSGWISGSFCKEAASAGGTSTSGTDNTSGTTTSTTQAASSGWLKIIGTQVNVRSGAGTDYEKVDTVKQNAWYKFSEVKTVGSEKWYKITIGTSSGWIAGTYAQAATEAANYVTLTGDNVNIRDRAEDGEVVTSLPINASYPYTESTTQNGVTWYKITVGNKTGWIVGTFVQVSGGTAPSGTGSDGSSTSTTQTQKTAPAAKAVKEYVRATNGKVNVRDAANGSNIVTTITEKMKDGWFKYTDTNTISGTKWYKIVIGNQSGWVSGNYLKEATTAEKYIRVTSNLVNVRNDANGSDIVAQVPQNCCYPFSETKVDNNTVWYKITVGSATGWINGNFVTVADPDTSGTTASSTTGTGTTTTGTAAGVQYLMVTGTTANIRESAPSGKVLGETYMNGWYPYTEVKTVNNVKWYKVTAGSVTGWVNGELVKTTSVSANYVRMTGDNVRVRASAPNGTVVANVRKNASYPYTDTKDVSGTTWYKITVGNKSGWVSGAYAKVAGSSAPTSTTKSTTKTTAPTTAIAGTARMEGSNRIATAIEISKRGWANGAKTVIIANGRNYADALAGVALSGAAEAPILLTDNRNNTLEADIVKEIERLGATKIYILGGSGVVSEGIEKSLAAKYTVSRVYGQTRYDTAIAIAKELRSITGKDFTTIYFASSANFPDALAISPVAAIEGNPVLYAPPSGKIDDATAAYIKSLGCTNGVIAGGSGAVSDDVLNSIISNGVTTVNRVSGQNRYETAYKINTTYKDLFSSTGIALATGQNFPDALAGGAFAARNKVPVILIDPKVEVAGLKTFVDSRIEGATDPHTYIFGGPGAVSNDTVTALIK